MNEKLADYQRMSRDARIVMCDEIVKLYKAGTSLEDLATLYSCTTKQMLTFLKNRSRDRGISIARDRKPFDKTLADTITSLYTDGYPLGKIAEMTNETEMRVFSFITHHKLTRDPNKLKQYRIQQTGYPYLDRRVARERTMLKKYGVVNWAHIDPHKRFTTEKKRVKNRPKAYMSWLGWCMTQKEYAAAIEAPTTCVRRLLPKRQVVGCYFPSQQLVTEIVDVRQIGNRLPDYIPNRYNDCQALKLRYVPVFYSEWVEKPKLVCAKIDELLETDAYKERPLISAEDCEPVLPLFAEATHFLHQYDFTPPVYGVCYGLKYQDELVAVAVMYGDDLYRFVVSTKYRVPGALEVLLRMLRLRGFTYIKTHVDARWYSEQNVFTEQGFSHHELEEPQTWYWTIGSEPLHYTKYIKNKMYPTSYFNSKKIKTIVRQKYPDFPKDAPFEEYMEKYGFFHLRDAGAHKYTLVLFD